MSPSGVVDWPRPRWIDRPFPTTYRCLPILADDKPRLHTTRDSLPSLPRLGLICPGSEPTPSTNSIQRPPWTPRRFRWIPYCGIKPVIIKAWEDLSQPVPPALRISATYNWASRQEASFRCNAAALQYRDLRQPVLLSGGTSGRPPVTRPDPSPSQDRGHHSRPYHLTLQDRWHHPKEQSVLLPGSTLCSTGRPP